MRKKWLPTMLAVLMLILLILPNAASAAPNKGNIIHVVQRGENLSTIALHYGVNMWTIARVNGITNPSRIYVGQRLVIPARHQVGRVHVVRRGENLTQIAWRYGVNVWAIARANGITNLNFVYVGQRLTIPGAPPPAKPAYTPPQQHTTDPGWYPGPWTGEYFHNGYVGGSPYHTRTDSAINFNWGYNPPVGGMPHDDFSVRWTGSFYFEGGTYRFNARVDDGVRMYVDGHRIIDDWRDGGFRLCNGDKALSAGHHTVQVEYYDTSQVARAHAWWDRIGGPAPHPAPHYAPYPSDQWVGHYYNNQTLTGPPVFTEYEPWIGFEWGGESPDPAVWWDHFSARWTRWVHLEQDHYRFCTMADDGSRIWVDDQLVLDEWHANNGVAYCGTFYATAGGHRVRVEYYEDGGDALIYVWWEPH